MAGAGGSCALLPKPRGGSGRARERMWSGQVWSKGKERGLKKQIKSFRKKKGLVASRRSDKLWARTLAERATTDLCKIPIYVRYSRTVTLPSTANSQLHEANATVTPDRCCYCSGQALQEHGTCCFCRAGGRSEGQKRILNRLRLQSLPSPGSQRQTGTEQPLAKLAEASSHLLWCLCCQF